MKYSYDSFCVDSKKNGVTDKAGKNAYPLHKIIAESKDAETKYGTNGLGGSTVGDISSGKKRGY